MAMKEFFAHLDLGQLPACCDGYFVKEVVTPKCDGCSSTDPVHYGKSAYKTISVVMRTKPQVVLMPGGMGEEPFEVEMPAIWFQKGVQLANTAVLIYQFGEVTDNLFDQSHGYVYVLTEGKDKFHPFCLAVNVDYTYGRVCFGKGGIPKTLKGVVNDFWKRPFTYFTTDPTTGAHLELPLQRTAIEESIKRFKENGFFSFIDSAKREYPGPYASSSAATPCRNADLKVPEAGERIEYVERIRIEEDRAEIEEKEWCGIFQAMEGNKLGLIPKVSFTSQPSARFLHTRVAFERATRKGDILSCSLGDFQMCEKEEKPVEAPPVPTPAKT